MSHASPATRKSWWQKIREFEPARVRYVIVGLVSIAAIWGLDVSGLGEQIGSTWDILYTILALVFTGEMTRRAVTPNKKVVAEEDPETGRQVAGDAAPMANGTEVTTVPKT